MNIYWKKMLFQFTARTFSDYSKGEEVWEVWKVLEVLEVWEVWEV